jgi:hypothetical protein
LETKTIRLPFNFEPRRYQLPLLTAMDGGFKRAAVVWHRRSGKDKTLVNLTAKKSFERKGCYYYYFPTATQGRKILWDGMDKAGFRFLDHFPKEIVEKRNDQEMRLHLRNGSLFQVVGTDRSEVVGPNPVGCVFSEYSLQNPKAWDFVRPILAENDGWAVFNFTPRGMNHGYQLFQMAQGNPEWFAQCLTVDDTRAVTKEAVEAERRAGMSEELIRQEFYCSWEYGLDGAYYLKQISRARDEDRIVPLPLLDRPVHTAWDLGVSDSTAIWFWQQDHGGFYNLIDYYESEGEGLAHYARVLLDKGYLYGRHYAPHDAGNRTLMQAKTLAEQAREELGLDFHVLPRDGNINAGIEVVRSVFPRCRFDVEKTRQGMNALMNYQKEYNDERRVFSERPLHNWASHGADAFRMFARAVSEHASFGDSMTDAAAAKMYEQYAPPVARI